MVTEPGTGDGREELDDGHDSRGCRNVDSRLSLLALDTKGSERCAALRHLGGSDAILASMRNAEGGSSAPSKWEDSDATMLRNSGGLCASGQRGWGFGDGGEETSLQPFREIEPPEFSNVPHRYREPVEETTSFVTSERLRDGDDILAENAASLDELVVMAAVKAKQILSLELPERSDPHYMRMVTAQKDLSVALFNTGLKADENRFRKRQTNILADLYARMLADENSKFIEG